MGVLMACVTLPGASVCFASMLFFIWLLFSPLVDCECELRVGVARSIFARMCGAAGDLVEFVVVDSLEGTWLFLAVLW